MTRWNNVQTVGVIALAFAAASAWLAGAGRSPADTPPADRVAEIEKRLQGVEAKLDRVLKLLEGRAASAPATPADIPHLIKARDDVQQALAKQEAAYADFRKRSPAGLLRLGSGLNVYTERLSMIEKRRAEFDFKQIELTSRLKSVERAYGDFGKAAAALAIQANEDKISNAAQKVIDDPKSKDQDLVQVYLRLLRANIADNIAMMADLDTKFLKARSDAKELQDYEAHEEELRRAVEKSRAELDAITERLQAAGWSPGKK
jgi:hypothetical protein